MLPKGKEGPNPLAREGRHRVGHLGLRLSALGQTDAYLGDEVENEDVPLQNKCFELVDWIVFRAWPNAQHIVVHPVRPVQALLAAELGAAPARARHFRMPLIELGSPRRSPRQRLVKARLRFAIGEARLQVFLEGAQWAEASVAARHECLVIPWGLGAEGRLLRRDLVAVLEPPGRPDGRRGGRHLLQGCRLIDFLGGGGGEPSRILMGGLMFVQCFVSTSVIKQL